MILTIGHSVRSAEDFLALLRTHGVAVVADVRTVPRSRRHPHFSSEPLAAMLGAHGIGYIHLPGLGGLRRPRPDSVNGGWKHQGFRGYADHMQTSEFAGALASLISAAADRQAAVMCAEARWWQCHRRLIADVLVARGIEVRHIMSAGEAQVHEMTAFARAEGSRVTYPALI